MTCGPQYPLLFCNLHAWQCICMFYTAGGTQKPFTNQVKISGTVSEFYQGSILVQHLKIVRFYIWIASLDTLRLRSFLDTPICVFTTSCWTANKSIIDYYISDLKEQNDKLNAFLYPSVIWRQTSYFLSVPEGVRRYFMKTDKKRKKCTYSKTSITKPSLYSIIRS